MNLLVLLLLMQHAASQQRGLFPAILNLASNAEITSNATCGDPQAEVYCKLVEHVPGRLIKNPHCPKCDGNSVLSKERHPITNAIDGTNQWWQSPSIKNGRRFHWVTITLDLKQVFQVAYVIVKAANSPRPGNWILERSADGVSFEPWQFYAISDSECLSRYNVAPRVGPPTYKGDSEVICTSYYSRLEPLEHGEIHTSLINSRPGADDLTSELLNFTSARFIRLRFQRIRTLNADLMTLSARDPRDVDPIVTRRYYYSVKDISVGGMCICYGHARSCPLDPVTKKLQCVCEHNTCGASCDRCCPGYHQRPWRVGTISEGHTCEKCNCHNKASDCFYNQTVADLRLSVNVRGVRRGGGVCTRCRQNTAGINCETCADRYFRPSQVSPYSESPCVECGCDPRGAQSPVCAREDALPGASAGQCTCKKGFAGRRCDRCAFGFREFPVCARCECNPAGSVNGNPCDSCLCKANVMGAHCDLCKAGFYNLQAANPLGCTDCFCFGVSDVCQSSAWFAAQVVSAEARLDASPSLRDDPALPAKEPAASGNFSSGHRPTRELSWEAPDTFLGNKLTSYGGLLNYSVLYGGSPDDGQGPVAARADIIIQGNGRALRLSPPHVLFLSPSAEHAAATRLLPSRFVDRETGVRVSRDDLLTVFAGVTSFGVRVHLDASAGGAMRLVRATLEAADPRSASGVRALAVETCQCPSGYGGTSCEVSSRLPLGARAARFLGRCLASVFLGVQSCLPGFYRVGGVLFGGNCVRCQCNGHASDCDANGACLGCGHHTAGPHCDRCLPGFYGDPAAGTADDCRRCACPLTEASNSFSPTCVLDSFGLVSCDRCREGYAGSRCHECSGGFYGDPRVAGGSCVRCRCNGNVDAEEAGHCHNVTGECLRCRNNTAGRHCEICAAGFYGDAVHRKNCTDCDCHVNGSLSSVCDAASGQCPCRDKMTGRACDRCQCDRCGRGHFGFGADGCAACACNHTSGNCDSHSGECVCPAHTEGDGCDACEAGYWGRHPVSGCQPCNCSVEGSAASQCERADGRCACREGFSGRSCDRCAPGHYGYPACSPCACPLRNNSYSPTCVSEGTLGGFRCTSCLTGYEGRYCERCSPGYYGTPSLPGGTCAPCGCSAWGSLHPLCDPVSGRCPCKAGVAGPACERCDDRHVLEGSECSLCDDRCAGALLDDLDRTHQEWRGVNIGGVAVAPHRRLVALKRQTADVQLMFSERASLEMPSYAAEEDSARLTSDLSLLGKRAANASRDWERAAASADDGVSLARRLMDKVRRVQDHIEALGREADHLNRAAEAAPETARRTQLLDRAASALESMRAFDLSGAASAARLELSWSESLVESLQRHFLPGAGESLRPLAVGLAAQAQRLQEAQTRLEDAAKENARTRFVMKATNALLGRYQAAHQNVSVACACAEEAVEAGRPLLSDALHLTGEFGNITAQADALGGQLDQWRPPLRRKVEALVAGLKSTDSLERVYRAESRAHLLLRHALSLRRALAVGWNASQNSSRLVAPDANVANAINEARRVASDAANSAGLAVDMTNRSDRTLSVGGGAGLSAISAALTESHAINKTAEDVRLKLSALTARRGMLSDRLRDAGVGLRHPIRELRSLSEGSSRAREAQSQAALAHSGLQEALRHLYALRRQLRDSSSAVEKSNLSATETDRLMTRTRSTADEARGKLEEAERRARRLSDKIKPLSALGESLSGNLSDIRELIEQARRQAASIKVAVQADGDCVRSYRPQIQSSNFNTLTLTVKTKSPNNLLFYMGGETTMEFLAVETHDGKVSLLWDVGSGGTRLEYPGLDIANNRWTSVNATRLGSRGFLSVHQPEAPPAQTVTAASPGPARVLHVDNGTAVHLGGVADGARRPAALRWSTFRGCLGEASLNEKNIGLWNYISRQGQCGGCFSSPQVEETSFHFDGSGFSLVQKSLRATSTSVVLWFKTLSPGGLLMYVASNNTRDFLSVELIEGCLRLTFDLGSGPLVLTSSRKYNIGVWYKVTLQRNRRKGYMSIMAADQSSEKEVLEAESPGTASDLNRSDLDPIYIGGLPASRPIRQQVASRSYVGCIKNVEIARLNFDLLRDAYGVRKGCVLEAVRSVSVLSGGFVQIAPRSLGQEAEFLFSFKSINQSGVLLAAFTDNPAQPRRFLSVHLLRGTLEAELGYIGADGRRVAAEGGSFVDGSKHSVIVNVGRKSLSIQADDGKLKSAPLAGGLPLLSSASFFIGGLPSGAESHLPSRLQKISKLFRGCVQYLALGDRLVDLSAAVRYEGAALDSCLLEEKSRGAVLPEDQDVEEATPEPSRASLAPPAPPTPTELTVIGAEISSGITGRFWTAGDVRRALQCAPESEMSFLPAAAHFGSSRHSHMTFTVDPVTVRKRLSVRLSLRTRARDGLLLLLADADRTDFAILRLAAGRALMSADLGKGVATAASAVSVNDGKWHTVTADVGRRSVSVSVDASAAVLAAVKGNQLDVDGRLYLGGLPPAHDTRRINVTTSLGGCVRSVSVNGLALDLSRPASRRDIASCFTKEETGSYFNGSGYAALMRDGYKVGSDVTVSLDFRTSQSEGVLLGISSAKVDAVGLEMIKGQVVFNVNNGAGRVRVASGGPALCDGRWHRLLARKTKHALSLNVDGRSDSIANPYPQSTSAETNNPVFVGGYPDGVKQNCLSTKRAFRGCLKNVRLIKSHVASPLDMSRAHFSLGVAPRSCPAA
ncbi:laminin subunit alpha-1 [Hippocampus comes]|uniref:laminin subunit alpha-1 n=1 Tax=Hippocampus comes TaxID=109280 RepID=UPI00094E67F0|nr:PREDICTED: laminin subunit alpha-1-like [Hippocampus comes]